MPNIAGGTTLPITLPILLEDSTSGSSNTITLPITLPVRFEGEVSSGVRLPVTLPIKFNSSNSSSSTIRLPVTLPIRFSSGTRRKTFSLPTKITCVYANVKGDFKFPIREYSNSGIARLPVKEIGWILVGLVLEENVIGVLKRQMLLIEDVRSRILADIEMVNGTDVRVKWYGDKVPTVEVYKKMTTDDNYDKIGTYTWGLESAIVTLGNSDYNLKLLGVNNTGESDVITVGETTYKELDVQVDIPLNEKIYSIPIKNIDKYTIPINY